jgi:hypothetical protein
MVFSHIGERPTDPIWPLVWPENMQQMQPPPQARTTETLRAEDVPGVVLRARCARRFPASEHISELLLYRVDPRHGNARIELTELAAHKGSERRRVSCRSDFETYGSEWARHL